MSKNRQFGFGLALAWLAFLVCFHTPIRQRKSPGVSLFFLILWDACATLLDLYGREVKLSEAEKYVEYYALAAGEHTEESFATWLRENSGPLKD